MVKKFCLLLGVAATLAAIAACSKADVNNENNVPVRPSGERRMLVASIDREAISKVALDDANLSLSWEENDAIAVIGSNGNVYRFTTPDGGSDNVRFYADDDDIPQEVEFWYAVYPYSAHDKYVTGGTPGESSEVRSSHMTIPTVQDGTGNCLILKANSFLADGKFTFVMPGCFIKMNIPAEWNVTKAVLRRESTGLPVVGLAGPEYVVSWYKDGKQRYANSGADAGEVTMENGGTLSGDLYFYIRHQPKLTAGGNRVYTLRLETSDGKVAFFRTEKLEIGDSKIYEFELDESPAWGDILVLDYDFTSGNPFSRVLTSNAATHSVGQKYNGQSLGLKVTADGYMFVADVVSGIACSTASGLNIRGQGSRLQLPVIRGMKPVKVEVTKSDAVAIAFRNESKEAVGSDHVTDATHVFGDFVEPGGQYQLTSSSTPYYIDQVGMGTVLISGLKITYIGNGSLERADGVTTEQPEAYLGSFVLKGAFTARNNTDLSNYTCGFQYKINDAEDWTDVAAESVAEAFQKSIDVAYAGETTMTYRAYVTVGGVTTYAPARSFLRISANFVKASAAADQSAISSVSVDADGEGSTSFTVADGKYTFELYYRDQTHLAMSNAITHKSDYLEFHKAKSGGTTFYAELKVTLPKIEDRYLSGFTGLLAQTANKTWSFNIGESGWAFSFTGTTPNVETCRAAPGSTQRNTGYVMSVAKANTVNRFGSWTVLYE